MQSLKVCINQGSSDEEIAATVGRILNQNQTQKTWGSSELRPKYETSFRRLCPDDEIAEPPTKRVRFQTTESKRSLSTIPVLEPAAKKGKGSDLQRDRGI